MIDERIEQALRSSSPVQELRTLAQRLLADGPASETVLEVFESARRELRAAGREADEDAVMDVMDFVVGWCSPHMKLSSGQPTYGGAEKPAHFNKT